MTEAVIVDVDGTLADVTGIRHYVNQHPKDFDAFHREAENCPTNKRAVMFSEMAHLLGKRVLIVTARMYRWEDSTRRFLKRHNIPYEDLYMRGDTDDRPDVDVKRDILRIIREDGYEVTAAIDDNPSIVALWESEGIPTTVVPGWDAWDRLKAIPVATNPLLPS